jgi:diguanylate cyclase (GGDEF)-like protein
MDAMSSKAVPNSVAAPTAGRRRAARPRAQPATPNQTVAPHEAERLEALDRLEILDSPHEEAFDRIARLIKNIFGVSIAIVSMIDGHRQWYKAWSGLRSNELKRRDTFCQQVLTSGQLLVVPDTRQDPSFADHPAVTGEPHVRFYAAAPLNTSKGHTVGTVCAIDTQPRIFSERDMSILSDLAGLAMDELELRRRAAYDGLTGVPTRLRFLEQGVREVALAQRHGHPLTGAILDIDRFKSVNDTYGHPVGDKVLAAVAQACRDVLRPTDLIGRTGGEEFGFLFPYTNLRAGLVAVERLRNAIEAQSIDIGRRRIRVTASIGVAALGPHLPDLDALMATADAALYRAKAAGRNRCVSTTDGESEARKRVLKAGLIFFDGRSATIDCTVRSLSSTGAGLDVLDAAVVPRSFRLLIGSDGFEAGCRITAQTAKHVEVEFC